MTHIPESIKKQITNPQPNVKNFVEVMTGRKKPTRAILGELFADREIMKWITQHVFEKPWTPYSTDRGQIEKHLLCQIEYWYRMGYDYIRVTGGADFPDKTLFSKNTAELSENDRGWINSTGGPIQSWDDYEKYPWPVVKDENLWMYEFVAKNIPSGMGVMVCPQSGFLEIPSDTLVGYEALSMMSYDQPDLVKAIFDRTREIIVEIYRRLVSLDNVAGFFQGDDMGFRTGTLFSPEFLRTHVLPGHKMLTDIAHAHNKIYILHSCGKLDAIMDDLIDNVKIDAKHSYEDAICPVEDFYDRYSSRIGVVGGLDIDILARANEATVRQRTRNILNHCMPQGRYAFGSGNTIANYSKPENVLAMFDEAYRWK
jgi:uroporphyrinogen decarboxylase